MALRPDRRRGRRGRLDGRGRRRAGRAAPAEAAATARHDAATAAPTRAVRGRPAAPAATRARRAGRAERRGRRRRRRAHGLGPRRHHGLDHGRLPAAEPGRAQQHRLLHRPAERRSRSTSRPWPTGRTGTAAVERAQDRAGAPPHRPDQRRGPGRRRAGPWSTTPRCSAWSTSPRCSTPRRSTASPTASKGDTPLVHSVMWSRDVAAALRRQRGELPGGHRPDQRHLGPRPRRHAAGSREGRRSASSATSARPPQPTIVDVLGPALEAQGAGKVVFGNHDCNITAVVVGAAEHRHPVPARGRHPRPDREQLRRRPDLHDARRRARATHPKYSTSDWFLNTSDATTPNFPPDQFDGAVGIASMGAMLRPSGKAPLRRLAAVLADRRRMPGWPRSCPDDAVLGELLAPVRQLPAVPRRAASAPAPNPTRASWRAAVADARAAHERRLRAEPLRARQAHRLRLRPHRQLAARVPLLAVGQRLPPGRGLTIHRGDPSWTSPTTPSTTLRPTSTACTSSSATTRPCTGPRRRARSCSPLRGRGLGAGRARRCSPRTRCAACCMGQPTGTARSALPREEAQGMLVSVDPPDHSALRRIVNRGFTPRRMQGWARAHGRHRRRAARPADPRRARST